MSPMAPGTGDDPEKRREQELLQADAALLARSEGRPVNRSRLATIGGMILVLLSKAKFLLVPLQFLKFGKLGGTVITMAAMVWAYSLRYGWLFAAAFVLLILIHELGHGFAARRLGLAVGAPVFIPFVGAFIALKDKPRDCFQDFVIGAGGPLAGSAAALVFAALSSSVGGTLGEAMLVLGYFGLTLNLFNLMPIGFLDGGRMSAPFRRREWALGVPILAAGYFFGTATEDHLNPTVLIVLAVAAYRTLKSFWPGRKSERALAEAALQDLQVTDGQRLIAAFTYFSLAALLIVLIGQIWPELPRSV